MANQYSISVSGNPHTVNRNFPRTKLSIHNVPLENSPHECMLELSPVLLQIFPRCRMVAPTFPFGDQMSYVEPRVFVVGVKRRAKTNLA